MAPHQSLPVAALDTRTSRHVVLGHRELATPVPKYPPVIPVRSAGDLVSLRCKQAPGGSLGQVVN